jgi:hypothetical protein
MKKIVSLIYKAIISPNIICKLLNYLNPIYQIEQINFILNIQQYKTKSKLIPNFNDVQFSCYSQNGEDGILLYIFSLIGTTNKKCVEICVGNILESNTANLIINHGWNGLLFDGNKKNIKLGKSIYSKLKNTRTYPPKFINAWITKTNINNLIEEAGFVGEIDLLSIDMDGNDWWIWKAIECINPRVVIVEYNNLWGPNKCMTIPYKDDFKAVLNNYGLDYGGASLAAFIKLAKEKEYNLIGVEKYGFNAFFVKSNLAEQFWKEVSPEDCFNHPFSREAMEFRINNILENEWVKF